MEETPLLRGYSTSSVSFGAQDFQVYELINLIRTDMIVRPTAFWLHEASLNLIYFIQNTIGTYQWISFSTRRESGL